jgi:YbgC/YbaW family acyl-CoA thioester hydrolase
VYTDRVAVRHNELDAFGRVYAAAYLRYLGQLAIDASTDAGFGSRWYDDAGLMWLVRRTSFEIAQPVGRDTVLDLSTWVEDFRRVRSYRRYEARAADGGVVATALTDWVLVDQTTGKPRRVPAEVEEAFGVATGTAAATRPPWQAPAPPAAPARSTHAVRFTDLDALAHVNNAKYVDVLSEGVLAAWGSLGWSVDRFRQAGLAPTIASGDVEYLESARHGDHLQAVTWFQEAGDGLDTFQMLTREDDPAPLVRAQTRWRWQSLAGVTWTDPPAELVAALGPLRAA